MVCAVVSGASVSGTVGAVESDGAVEPEVSAELIGSFEPVVLVEPVSFGAVVLVMTAPVFSVGAEIFVILSAESLGLAELLPQPASSSVRASMQTSRRFMYVTMPFAESLKTLFSSFSPVEFMTSLNLTEKTGEKFRIR